jgi:hypothetical protein
MNLPQENFDRAVRSGEDTLRTLIGQRIVLEQESTQSLRTLMWDLEAIGAAVRLELMNRDPRPVDFG